MLQYIILVYKNERVANIYTTPEELLNHVHQHRDAIATSVWIYDDEVVRMDLDAIDEFEIEYAQGKEDNNMLRTVECPRCKKDDNMRAIGTDTFHCMDCDIIINTAEENRCPDCGAYTYETNRVESDTTMGLYCMNSHKTIHNQYLTHDDFLEDEGEQYRDCDLIRQRADRECLETFRTDTAVDIGEGLYDIAYNSIIGAMNDGLECGENECDNCPIVLALNKTNFVPDSHGQYVTCSAFISQYDERRHTSASEASTRNVSDAIVEGAKATNTI